MSYTDARAAEGTLPPRRTAFGMVDTDVSDSKLRALDIMGAIVSIIIVLGPLAAATVGMR
jgi:hypothetical protein